MTTTTQNALPHGIETYDSKSEELARRLAKSANPKYSDRKKLGELLILESTAALEHALSSLTHEVDRVMRSIKDSSK
jgi:hypothetical protein